MIQRMPAAGDILGRELNMNLQQAEQERDRAQALLKGLLEHAGNPGYCRNCGLRILWVKAGASGRSAPYDPDGVSHFTTCPRATDRNRNAYGTNTK